MSNQPLKLALVGNPNCGKTALFNRLTGGRQKVANYPGVTVERKLGRFTTAHGRSYFVLDLPGAYSLLPTSVDEAITRDVCSGKHPSETQPDVLVCVLDASNLRLHLRFALEVRALKRPMIVVLNRSDVAKRLGIQIDRSVLAGQLGVPVVETVAVRRAGIRALLDCLDQSQWASLAGQTPQPTVVAATAVQDNHAQVRALIAASVMLPARVRRVDDVLDRWLLHPVLGLLSLAVVMFFMFQAVYAWATPLMDFIKAQTQVVGQAVQTALPSGPLQSLLTDGIIAGLGTVVAFLPQILILSAFIFLLEESGYLPRAAFLLDSLMSYAGLSGRSFIPLLSSFACAVPGIMSTRTIQDPHDRLRTILIAPLMTCSARLPVYALLIGAFVPPRTVLGAFNQQGVVLFGLYAMGIVSGFLVSWSMKRRHRRVRESMLVLELPAYHIPDWRDLGLHLWERTTIFLKRVGGVILALTILLWSLLSFPGPPPNAPLPAIHYSLAGLIGHAMSTVFAPVGFNWQIDIALIPGLAAREVAISALATVYALSAQDNDSAAQALTPLIQHDWSLATALSLLVWYVYAPMCLSTYAAIRRETGSWTTVAVSLVTLLSMAYGASFLTYHLTLWFMR